jgi:hypothetical protein
VLDERHGISKRKRPRPWGVQVAAHGPRPFVVMRVGRHPAIGELDTPPIEELAAERDSHEHCRVGVLGDADGRSSLRCSSRAAYGFVRVHLLGIITPLLAVGFLMSGKTLAGLALACPALWIEIAQEYGFERKVLTVIGVCCGSVAALMFIWATILWWRALQGVVQPALANSSQATRKHTLASEMPMIGVLNQYRTARTR